MAAPHLLTAPAEDQAAKLKHSAGFLKQVWTSMTWTRCFGKMITQSHCLSKVHAESSSTNSNNGTSQFWDALFWGFLTKKKGNHPINFIIVQDAPTLLACARSLPNPCWSAFFWIVIWAVRWRCSWRLFCLFTWQINKKDMFFLFRLVGHHTCYQRRVSDVDVLKWFIFLWLKDIGLWVVTDLQALCSLLPLSALYCCLLLHDECLIATFLFEMCCLFQIPTNSVCLNC